MHIYSDEHGHVGLIDVMGSDKRVVNAARVSFLKNNESEPITDKDQRLIEFLARHGHTSPFEHCTATFLLSVPVFVSRQIMRHRTFSYNEVSRRYTCEAIEFFFPEEMRAQSKDNLQCSDGVVLGDHPHETYNRAIQAAWISYVNLINQGVSRELARGVLPQAAYTMFYMTGNLHNWIKFIKLRDHEHAQPETQVVAKAIKSELIKHFPCSMHAWFKGE